MVDYQIQNQGLAYTNSSGLFYPALSNINGLYCYTTSYKQLCNDTSISGANILSGVYINGNYVGVGQSGLTAINHYNGALYFNSPVPAGATISGNFSIKELSTQISDQPDYKILFESKFTPNPKYSNTTPTTGLAIEDQVAPAIFLIVKQQQNKPFAFAGIDDNFIRLRAIAVCDSVYQKIAVNNIFKNFHLKPVPVPAIGAFPLDYLGNFTGINYNYTGMATSDYYKPIVLRSVSIEVPQKGEYFDIKKQFAITDFDISCWSSHS
jgi:hypothetical protein